MRWRHIQWILFCESNGTGLVDCMVQTCTGSGTSSAFNLTALTRCQMVRCYAFANSSVQDIVGLNLTLGTSCSLADCIAAGNSATSNATGITIAVPTSCTIDNCAAYRNVGTASSTGIVSGGAAALFSVMFRYLMAQHNFQDLVSINSRHHLY